jgi:deoxyribodipyrimidine photolyase
LNGVESRAGILNGWADKTSFFPGKILSCSAEELGLEDSSEKSSNALLARAWCPGWSYANKSLEAFLQGSLLEYATNRQKVDGVTTSLLSPHLHFGELSVRKLFYEVRTKQVTWTREANAVGEQNVTLFLRSIGFREYSRYLSFHFPFTHERSLLANLKSFPWRVDEAYFKAWRQGRTGYPLVDAGMRELWATGWLHNQIRIVVSSFFVKFLQLPWRWGMKYFWDTLLDADLECDVLGWQYISGSLPDGHELDRMDNPQVLLLPVFDNCEGVIVGVVAVRVQGCFVQSNLSDSVSLPSVIISASLLTWVHDGASG